MTEIQNSSIVLSLANPELLSEWDYDKNAPLTPDNVTVGSSRKVWWKCSQGHDWYAVIYHRAKGVGCPYCLNKRVWKGFNDLASQRPEIATEWNFEKNKGLVDGFGNDISTPEKVVFSAGYKVWWICLKGHEWEAVVGKRTGEGNGCPYCSGKYVTKGENDLATTHPELAKEWDYSANGKLTPHDISAGSNKKVWWRCRNGHKYQAQPNSRKNGAGCPICIGHSVLAGFNDLATLNPSLALEWDYEKNTPLTPQCVTCGSHKKVWWKCNVCNNVWCAQIKARNNGTGCPVCSAQNLSKTIREARLNKIGSLLENDSPLLKEWDYEKNAGITPDTVTPSSTLKVWWKCEYGHEWKAKVDSRNRGSGCPFCSGRRVCVGFNDLLTKKPELEKEWDYEKNAPLTPQDVTYGSHKNIWWKCNKCSYQWQAPVKNRVNGSGCMLCGVKSAHDKTRQTQENFEAKLMINNPDVLIIGQYLGISQKIRCKGRECAHEWEALPYNLLNGSGCPICWKTKPHERITNHYKSRAKSNEDFLDELKAVNVNITPLDKYTNNKMKIRLKCELCGNIWMQTPDAALRGQGCPACNHASTSFFEQLIFECMKLAYPKTEVVSRDRKTIGLELDVFIPSIRIAIEYGAWYWHKNQLHRDEAKQKRCQENNIRLITIYDGCNFDMEDIGDIYYFSKAIGEDFELSKKVIYKIMTILGLSRQFSNKEWQELRNKAYKSSRRKTTEKFREEIKKIDPTIEILGEYKSSITPILVKCMRCGKVWNTKPNYLSSGNGCPDCNTGRKTHEEFIAIVNSKNPNIIVLSEYRGSVERVNCKCSICGFEWSPLASGLLHGYGCPQCAGLRKKLTLTATKEEIKSIHPNISIIGEFRGANYPAKCKCEVCGNIWNAYISNLLSGRGCPACTYERKRKENSRRFLTEMMHLHPTIEVLEEYQNNNTRILCRCKKCGYEWYALPKTIKKQNGGCKKCNINKRAQDKRMPVINVTTGIIYESIAEASIKTGIDRNQISNCCRGKNKTAGGYHWKLKNKSN